MPRVTPALAKNTIRRALRAVIDAEPSRAAIAELWKHFESRCAYCGRVLDKPLREGHIDHLAPTTRGGTNHLSNRVLSCSSCNGDEKRERDWREFLREKNSDAGVFDQRRTFRCDHVQNLLVDLADVARCEPRIHVKDAHGFRCI